ncbi:hypothetical protein NPIL_612981, partial [Nephila pilipes]
MCSLLAETTRKRYNLRTVRTRFPRVSLGYWLLHDRAAHCALY